MGQDISGDVADLIGDAKVFDSSDNIRHGKYQLLIRRIRAEKIENDKGSHRMGFVEVTPLKSEPNPQVEGDRVDYVSPQQPGTGPLKDDGTKPNVVGSRCAAKVDFDGPGGRSAGANIKAIILALFNKRDGEVPNDEIKKTWRDLARQRDLNVGEIEALDHNNQPIQAKTAKRANPACGMIINCETRAHRKKTANEKGAYITKLIWSCAAPIGTGINADAEVAKRRAEIEAQFAEEEEEEAVARAPVAPSSGVINAPTNGNGARPGALDMHVSPPAPPPPAPPAVAPPPPPWAPQKPWVAHPTAPGYFWSNPTLGGDNTVKSEAQLRTGA